MIYILIGLIGFGFLIFTFSKRNKSNRRNYSLGLKTAEDIAINIQTGDYDTADSTIRSADYNDITQIVDHVALSLSKETLQKWSTASASDFSKICLGVFYLHQAWIERSHSFGKDVYQKKANLFFENLELSVETFSEISETSQFYPEVLSRKIRLQMSLGNSDDATACFNEVSGKYPELIDPYIHYAEMIQPKWGGTLKSIETFVQNLPDDYLIRSIVELKLIHDSLIMDDNYFVFQTKNLIEFAQEKIRAIDNKLSSNTMRTVHRYILYNYMESVAHSVNDKSLLKKYGTLSANKQTLYPHGLVV